MLALLNFQKLKSILFKDSAIPYIIAFICIGLFAFNFWLFYPGYIMADWIVLMATWGMDNHYPVMYVILLKWLSDIFGRHIYMPLFFNLIPFYLGLFILCLGAWKRFHSKWCFLFLLLIFIGNIFFNNILLHSTISSSMFVFVLWSLVLYQILVGITRTNMICVVIAFIFTILSRHNALIQVYPIFFIYSYLLTKQMKQSYIWAKYIGLLIFFAFFTISTALGLSSLLKKGTSYPANHIFLHQIAGACIPNNDESCFRKEWYDYGKNYNDVIKAYENNELNADTMSAPWLIHRPFKTGKLDGLKTAWLKAIIKYPRAYFVHILRFIKEMWTINTTTSVTPYQRHYSKYMNDITWLKSLFLEKELFNKPSSYKITIYKFLRLISPCFNTIYFVVLNFVLFIIIGILLYKRRDILLLYALSSLISSIGGSFIFCIFSPVPADNYIHPILTSTIMAIVGLIVYFCSKNTNTPATPVD